MVIIAHIRVRRFLVVFRKSYETMVSVVIEFACLIRSGIYSKVAQMSIIMPEEKNKENAF